MARKRKKSKRGHARKNRKLRHRYGRSFGTSAVTMNVTGTLVLDPQQLEAAVEEAVAEAADTLVPEVVAEAEAAIEHPDYEDA